MTWRDLLIHSNADWLINNSTDPYVPSGDSIGSVWGSRWRRDSVPATDWVLRQAVTTAVGLGPPWPQDIKVLMGFCGISWGCGKGQCCFYKLCPYSRQAAGYEEWDFLFFFFFFSFNKPMLSYQSKSLWKNSLRSLLKIQFSFAMTMEQWWIDFHLGAKLIWPAWWHILRAGHIIPNYSSCPSRFDNNID